MTDEDIHKQRFLMFAAARLSGVVLIMLGMAVAFTDLVRDGGFRQVGGLLIAIGTIEMVVLPILLKRSWDRR